MPPETQQTAAKILEQLKEIIEQELQVIALNSGRHLTIAPRFEFEQCFGLASEKRAQCSCMLLIA
jgi:hypothetical protein